MKKISNIDINNVMYTVHDDKVEIVVGPDSDPITAFVLLKYAIKKTSNIRRLSTLIIDNSNSLITIVENPYEFADFNLNSFLHYLKNSTDAGSAGSNVFDCDDELGWISGWIIQYNNLSYIPFPSEERVQSAVEGYLVSKFRKNNRKW